FLVNNILPLISPIQPYPCMSSDASSQTQPPPLPSYPKFLPSPKTYPRLPTTSSLSLLRPRPKRARLLHRRNRAAVGRRRSRSGSRQG
ncbi:hypothetical protein K525DRAFT_258350, partial [Schizophyllum commune Loenen D]